MITLEVKYKNQATTVNLYNEWDIDKEDVIDKKIITKQSQRGKYVLYDDGWGLYGRVKGATINAYVTESGIIKRKDYCSFSRVQYPYTNYSGSRSYDEHPLSRPFRRVEYLQAGSFIKTNNRVKLTPRIKMLVKDKIEDMLGKFNVDAEFIISKLVREADHMRGRGTDRIEAIKCLARLQGVELEKQTRAADTGPTPLFMQFNTLSIQDQRRQLPTAAELGSQIIESGLPSMREEEALLFVGEGKKYSGMVMKKKPENPDMIVEDGILDES